MFFFLSTFLKNLEVFFVVVLVLVLFFFNKEYSEFDAVALSLLFDHDHTVI